MFLGGGVPAKRRRFPCADFLRGATKFKAKRPREWFGRPFWCSDALQSWPILPAR